MKMTLRRAIAASVATLSLLGLGGLGLLDADTNSRKTGTSWCC